MTRRRYRWDDETQQLVEVDPDYAPRDERQPVYTDRYMEGMTTVEGIDISSRAKRRAYMKANNLADADDFKETWARRAKEREAIRSGEAGRAERREAIARAMELARTGRR